MATMMTKKQFCERIYEMYKLLGGSASRCAHCSAGRVWCAYS